MVRHDPKPSGRCRSSAALQAISRCRSESGGRGPARPTAFRGCTWASCPSAGARLCASVGCSSAGSVNALCSGSFCVSFGYGHDAAVDCGAGRGYHHASPCARASGRVPRGTDAGCFHLRRLPLCPTSCQTLQGHGGSRLGYGSDSGGGCDSGSAANFVVHLHPTGCRHHLGAARLVARENSLGFEKMRPPRQHENLSSPWCSSEPAGHLQPRRSKCGPVDCGSSHVPRHRTQRGRRCA